MSTSGKRGTIWNMQRGKLVKSRSKNSDFFWVDKKNNPPTKITKANKKAKYLSSRTNISFLWLCQISHKLSSPRCNNSYSLLSFVFDSTKNSCGGWSRNTREQVGKPAPTPRPWQLLAGMFSKIWHLLLFFSLVLSRTSMETLLFQDLCPFQMRLKPANQKDSRSGTCQISLGRPDWKTGQLSTPRSIPLVQHYMWYPHG